MTASSAGDAAAAWFRAHAHQLTTMDPEGALDDLEPLRELAAGARVVAVGEGAHFVAEFGHLRQRIIRFLAERCGFRVLAFEFGFAEAFALDRWLRGDGDPAALARFAGTANSGLTGDLARWLRGHNATSGAPLRLVGIDTPEAGGALRPALEPVARYLDEVDPDLRPVVDRALALGDRIAGPSVAAAAPRWARLDPAERATLTASLARLAIRFRALEPLYIRRSDRQRYDLAAQHLDAAVHGDYMVGAMHDLFTGAGLPGDTSARDRFMAESLRWHLDRAEPDARVVVVAHNNHIQREPVRFDGHLTALPLGHYLDHLLGEEYRALALTHTAGSVPEMYPDDTEPAGFAVTETGVAPPSAGSVERAVLDAGLGAGVSLTDLRPLRTRDGAVVLERIRTQSAELDVPVPTAFDGVLCVPTVTPRVETRLR
ncbi:erythromycin esterase [Prauserella shujinwangii]|uniref:Erythromycin esterase n=1 Tax=Prauserella shujinwangii TaxID=1453103 RepID=A0A2T0LT76_9PSEU|nr:erythromycin esterase family protein [Prauserella shujinwangii]PRX46948.1 erythromycin esterase [Prauserella shujinwangii]